jgi:hypothetical protein
MTLIIVIILIILLVGGLPTWGYSRNWRGGRGLGYGPSGVLTIILVIILILWLMGRL